MKKLYYQEFGQRKDTAQTVVLLHGLFGQSDNLTGLAKHLSGQFNVIVPDLINHGRSPHRITMDYPSMARDIVCLMDDMQLKVFKIFGHSMGGKVAMQLALEFPEVVESLIVADIAPVIYPPHHTEILKSLNKVAESCIKSRQQADNILSETIDDQYLRHFFLKSLKRVVDGEAMAWCYGLDEIIGAYQQICEFPKHQVSYKKETLFIKGSESFYLVEEYRDEVMRLFPLSKLKIIQGAGHWLHIEKPKVFNQMVKNFFEGQN